MSIIATLTASDTGFDGQLQTLTIDTAIRFVAVDAATDKAPDFRIYAGERELGAGWSRTSQQDRRYVSAKLDDPSFATPLYASLVEGDDGKHLLIWSR